VQSDSSEWVGFRQPSLHVKVAGELDSITNLMSIHCCSLYWL